MRREGVFPAFIIIGAKKENTPFLLEERGVLDKDKENKNKLGVCVCVWRLEQVEFCALPMTTLGVVSDGVISLETDPVRDRPVLPLPLAQDTLNLQRLVCAHFARRILYIEFLSLSHSFFDKKLFFMILFFLDLFFSFFRARFFWFLLALPRDVTLMTS